MVVFSGTVTSDFLKFVSVEDLKKDSLINYGATDFMSLRSALVDYIKAVYPLDYQNFVESDLGMMLIELTSYMGAVMSLKADMLANENFLRTCRQRSSVIKLLDLIGIRLRGPLSAAASSKITLGASPWNISQSGETMTIGTPNRAVTITSPEDGGEVSYTIYKVESTGKLSPPTSDGGVTLYGSESDNDTSTVFTNIALLEGSFNVEQGAFDTTEAVKSLTLANSPVIDGSVEVFVDGTTNTSGAYKEVDNLYFASGEGDKIYQTLYDDSYAATVVFGDNTLGRSPTAGDTYIITYRTGGGTRGNISAEIINTVTTAEWFSPLGSSSVEGVLENVSQATGGQNAETIEHAKQYAPLAFRRQDRLVTLEDFKTFANRYISNVGSVGKATAVTRRAYSSANIIDVYILEKANDIQLKRATPAFKFDLLDAMNGKKMLTDEVVIVDGLIRTLDLVVTVRIDKEYLSRESFIKMKVMDAIQDFFNVNNIDFGKTFIPDGLNRKIFEIDEVRWSTLDNVDSAIKVQFNEIVQLNNVSINIVGVE